MKFDKNTKILIVGLGLIGGSYAKALSDEGYFVGAIDKKKSSVEYALKNGLIQVGETSVKKDFVKDFDLIVFALYPHDFINWIKEYQSSIKSGALITDVTGVKSFVVENVQKILRGDLEEFFHTFNALHSAGKQIILTSDKPPKDMETLEERIRSRFEWGLMADIGAPDYETRMAILRRKVESDDMSLSDDILNYIANNIKSNIRELEGALNKLLAYSNLEKTEITMEIAKKELQNIITPDKPREITPQLIIEVVSEHFQISLDQMISKNRSNEIARPRQIAMYLCKTMTDIPLDSIGSLLGGRDHSTIIHGIKKIADEYDSNEQTRNLIETIKKKINPN